jgi:glycosyltransferase involved in cell wall biosynthesis
MLDKSVDYQKDVKIEKIYLLGDNKTYHSAGAAFNDAISKASGEFIFFIHQDIYLNDEYLIYNACKYLSENPKTIVGLMGVNKNKYYSNMYHGLLDCNLGLKIDFPIEVDAFDEVFLGGRSDYFKYRSFDSTVIDGWHLYVVDYCYNARLKDGYKCMILPYSSTHKSVLEWKSYVTKVRILPPDFFDLLNKLRKKYKKNLKIIYTPCITIKTNYISYYSYILLKRLQMMIRRKIRAKNLNLEPFGGE